MSRTITAMYDSRSEAESAQQRLASIVDAGSVRIVDQSSTGGSSTDGKNGDSWFSRMFMPDEDRHAHGEGVRRGGYLLTAEADDEESADRIIDVLEQTSPIDFDERQQSWRQEGWSPQSSSYGQSATGAAAMGGGSAIGSSSGDYGDRAIGTDRGAQEERIPIVEEQLRVGKREVSRGGARVRSYVKEVPVHEQVSLREEHVSVERRPVDQTLGAADPNRGDLLQNREIEMTATAEEAVVGKEARVTEEVVVRKTADQRTEQIDDTVRHTEVDVDKGTSTTEDRGAFGFRDDDSSRR